MGTTVEDIIQLVISRVVCRVDVCGESVVDRLAQIEIQSHGEGFCSQGGPVQITSNEYLVVRIASSNDADSHIQFFIEGSHLAWLAVVAHDEDVAIARFECCLE